MIYIIKIIFILILSYSVNATGYIKNEIIFKINNKFFTNVDLEKRTKYIELSNNLDSSLFSEVEKIEIFNDYISSILFYEYYNENKLSYEELNEKIEEVYKKIITGNIKITEEEIENFKLNVKIDLIRKKIIEDQINLDKNSLLQEANTQDLIYNYKLRNIIIKENLIDKELYKNISSKKDFNNFKKYIEDNGYDFFYKEVDINDNNITSNKIKKIINKNIQIDIYSENGYINLISIDKNLESYKGIFVKLVNFISNSELEKEDLQCNNLNKEIFINKTIYKEYEYSKLNNKIKNNLKSVNDYVLFNENDEYNYIILCDLTYDEKLLKNLNFNKNLNTLVNKIQTNFLKKYKNEYKFVEIK